MDNKLQRLSRRGSPETETTAALKAIHDICDAAGLPMGQAALAWLLAQPGVATVITGARNPAQILANAEAVSRKLPDDARKALADVTEPRKVALGHNPDLWQGQPNSRIR